MAEIVSYIQPQSFINPSFWSKLTELKLNVDKLDETPKNIWGSFSIIKNPSLNAPFLEVDSTSFNSAYNGQNIYVPFCGRLINKNTIESFKECDKVELLNKEGDILYKNIISGKAICSPSCLNALFVLTFCDLKKYNYYYWFAFPVAKGLVVEKISQVNILEKYDKSMVSELYLKFLALSDHDKTFFIIEETDEELLVHSLAEKITSLTLENVKNIYFTFFNISGSNDFLGSQLRNYILLILYYCPFLESKTQNFIAINRLSAKQPLDDSVILNMKLPSNVKDCLNSWVGWEKNERDKMGPRMVNMKNTLDPEILAENSVNLNLKLMKWRLMPDINLEKIESTKCLLLGAGTLGCSVARCLLGWGVRHITFVDNSTVSYSNPVRQSLFTFEDSVRGRPKAEAAADNLKKIFPGVESKGVQISIPMPGHPVGDILHDQTVENVKTLTNLIESHDIVFLLTDSRESRWLPTMLGSYYKKIVINAALGFDSYLVMRHGHYDKIENLADGMNSTDGFTFIQGDCLGCYFCNDISAPGDSIKNRTLDQQCTVTRPGVSQIAGALAAELAISILQHKNGIKASAFYKSNKTDSEIDPEVADQCILGLIPHSIRGFISTYQQIIPATLKYNQCVACSEFIMKEYEKNGINFLFSVFNSSKYLEDVTQLTEMFNDFILDEVLELNYDDEI